MSSSQRGTNTSSLEVTNISPNGIWVLIRDEELFMPYEDFPWFKKANVEQILNVVEELPDHYHWPDLDIDISLKSIRNPQDYPLRAGI